MKKSIFVKALSLLICVLIIVPTFSVSAENDFADGEIILGKKGESEKVETNDEKIYCDATIEDDFANDCVLVVLDKNVGGINKVHSKSFFNSVGIKSITDLTAMSDATSVNTYEFRQILRIELSEKGKKNVLNAIKKLEKIDGVISAEPSYFASFCGVLPNDDLFDEQWALRKIEVDEAWEITTGLSTVRVGVIDSGIDATHSDLSQNVSQGFNFVNNNTVTTDEIGHGTTVAGVIAATGNNYIGISGTAWNADIIPLKVNSAQSISLDGIVNGVSIITSSLRTDGIQRVAQHPCIIIIERCAQRLKFMDGECSFHTVVVAFVVVV